MEALQGTRWGDREPEALAHPADLERQLDCLPQALCRRPRRPDKDKGGGPPSSQGWWGAARASTCWLPPCKGAKGHMVMGVLRGLRLSDEHLQMHQTSFPSRKSRGQWKIKLKGTGVWPSEGKMLAPSNSSLLLREAAGESLPAMWET